MASCGSRRPSREAGSDSPIRWSLLVGEGGKTRETKEMYPAVRLGSRGRKWRSAGQLVKTGVVDSARKLIAVDEPSAADSSEPKPFLAVEGFELRCLLCFVLSGAFVVPSARRLSALASQK